jgi:hypothetical protein
MKSIIITLMICLCFIVSSQAQTTITVIGSVPAGTISATGSIPAGTFATSKNLADSMLVIRALITQLQVIVAQLPTSAVTQKMLSDSLAAKANKADIFPVGNLTSGHLVLFNGTQITNGCVYLGTANDTLRKIITPPMPTSLWEAQ